MLLPLHLLYPQKLLQQRQPLLFFRSPPVATQQLKSNIPSIAEVSNKLLGQVARESCQDVYEPDYTGMQIL